MPKELKQQFPQDIQLAIDRIKISDFTSAVNLALKKYFNKTRYLDLFLENISNTIKEFLEQKPGFNDIIDNNINTLLSLAEENENYDLFIARFYELKGDDENAIRRYQNIIDAPIKQAALKGVDVRAPAPSIVAHLYLGRLFYRTEDFEKAIENYHKAQEFVDNVLICNSSAELNKELTKYYSDKIHKAKEVHNEFEDYSEPYETVEQYHTEKIALIAALRNSYEQRSQDYKKRDKLAKAQEDKKIFNRLTKDLANMYWERAFVYDKSPPIKSQQTLDDRLSAVNLFPHPNYYFYLAETYHKLNKPLKTVQHYVQSYSTNPELIVQYPEETTEITKATEKNEQYITSKVFSPVVKDLMKLVEACNATKTLPEYINLWNQGIISINKEIMLEREKIPEITLLKEVQKVQAAKKSAAEIAKVYNKHLNEIKEEHLKFSNLKESTYPPSLVELAGIAGLVANAHSEIFQKAKADKKLPKEVIEVIENNPLVQIITFNPS